VAYQQPGTVQQQFGPQQPLNSSNQQFVQPPQQPYMQSQVQPLGSFNFAASQVVVPQ
jgi:hypothetical protein